jgi:NAD(P)-dependent dehydrogenase (short-subunit alcohol dehydrogenase family)
MSEGGVGRLDGKIAIVTGGTQGLGAAIARLFAERGVAGIVTCGRSVDKGQARAAEITAATGVPMEFVAADLAKVEDCRAVVAAADKRFGRVDVLVNVAAITDRGTIIDTSPELFDRIFAINTRAPFFLMQDVVKLMKRDAIEGSIVNISSMSAMAGQPFIAAYCASKGALDTLTRNTAYALLRNRIRVKGSMWAGCRPAARTASSASSITRRRTGSRKLPRGSRMGVWSIRRKWREPRRTSLQRSPG